MDEILFLRSFSLRLDAPNNLAKSSLIPDLVIARALLRPCGHGLKPRSDSYREQGNNRDLNKEEAP
jgi:hypothetical protein